MNVSDSNNLYKLTLAIVCSICSFLLIAIGINLLYHPDIAVITQKASKLLFVMWGLNPEPKEKLIYLSGIFLLPSFFILFLHIFRNRDFSEWEKRILELSCIFAYIAIAVTSLLQKDIYGNSNLFSSLFSKLVAYEYSLQFITLPFILMSILFILERKKIAKIDILYNWLGLIFLFIIPIIIIFYNNIYSFPPGIMHFDAVFYSQSQVNMGTPMLIDGFANTYGLYPHFLQPIFSIIGLSTFNFSFVMSILIVVCFASLFWFLLRETKNKILSIISIGSILMSYIYWRNYCVDSYFQLFPIRTLFPCMILLLASLYKTKKSKLYFILITAFCSIGLLWNPDMGIFTFIAWIAFAIYTHTVELTNWIEKIKKLVQLLGIAILILTIIFAAYSFIIYCHYGAFPDLTKLFSTILVFSGLGFYMLPMQIIHPWIIFAIWILIGLALSISAYLKNKGNYSIIFIASFICIGFFSYYQGRSHTAVFAATAPFMLTLLCLLISKINFNSKSILIQFFAYAGIFIFIMTIPAIVRYDILFFNNKNIIYGKHDMPDRIKADIAFIKQYSKPEEKIFIVDVSCQGILYNETQTISIFNPGYVELFFIKDVERLLKIIHEKQIKIFTRVNEADPSYIHVADNGSLGLYLSTDKPVNK